jgi:hypothetical protein
LEQAFTIKAALDAGIVPAMTQLEGKTLLKELKKLGSVRVKLLVEQCTFAIRVRTRD